MASGALAGVATLTRVDGLLLAVAPAVAWWVRPGQRSVLAGAGSAAAYLLVLAPWLVRDMAVFGAPFPSAGGHTLWITTYNEQFSIGHEPTSASYFGAGIGTVVGSKLATWGELLGRIAVLMGGLFILPFGWGLWAERRRRELAPFLIYFLVGLRGDGRWSSPSTRRRGPSTTPPPRGCRSRCRWPSPRCRACATAAGRWWPFLRRPATHRFLLVAGLVGAAALSLVGSGRAAGQWNAAHDRLALAAGYLRDEGATGDRVLAYDPAALHVLTGNPGVAPPFDPLLGHRPGGRRLRRRVGGGDAATGRDP